MKIECLIVDDEPIARKGMKEFIADVEFLHLAGECGNAMKAGMILESTVIDLVILDIQMPKVTGIEFLRALKNPPLAILTTAYPDYALEGFALDVVDYLMKPVAFDRFLKAVTKAKDLIELKRRPPADRASQEYFFIKSGGRYERVFFKDLVYAEAYQNYCILHLPGRKLITYMTFTALENQLPADQFMKVHKSYIVALSKVEILEGSDLKIGEITVPVSRNLKEEVKKRIVGKNLIKRMG